MAFSLPNLGKRLDEYGGQLGQLFGSAAQGLGNVAKDVGKGVLDSAVNAGRTVADLPVQAAKSVYYLSRGDIQGAANAQRNSYIDKQYGSQFAGDTRGLGNAAAFGLDVAGLKGGGSLVKQGIKASLPKVALKGAAGGAGFGGAYGLAQSAQQNDLSYENTARNIGMGALLGGATGGAVPVAGRAVSTMLKPGSPLRNQAGYIGQPRAQGKFSTGQAAPDYVDARNPQSVFERTVGIKQQLQGAPGRPGLEVQWKIEKQLADNPSLSAHERLKRNEALENSDLTRQLRDLYDEQEQLGPVLQKHFPAEGRPVTTKSILRDEGGFLGLPRSKSKPQVKLAKSSQNPSDLSYVSTENGPQPLLPKSVAQPVKLRDKAFRSTRSIIERQGESGKQLAEKLRQSRDVEELQLAQIQKATPTVHALAKEATKLGKGKNFENFIDAVEGKTQPMNPKIAQAVAEWRAVAPSIRERAVQAGLDVGDLGPNYYPHFVDFEKLFKNNSSFNEAVNHLVNTGQAKDTAEAIKTLGFARDTSRNRKFGNLEASRMVDLPMFDKSPNSLGRYLQGSTRRTAQTETFGAKDEKALDLIAKAAEEGFDAQAMKDAYDVAVGARKYNPDKQRLSQNMRQYITTTRLGLGALTNTSQSVNTGIVTGHFRTMGAMLKQLNPKTREYVMDTGVISDAVLQDIKEQVGFTGKLASKITAPGFQAVEKFNRSVAATAGKDYALRLAQKGDEATLRKLRVTGPIENKTLTPEQQIQASRAIVEKTQFKVDPQDLPGWTSSPGGRLVSQFRTFSYNQGKFFSNEILKPMKKGNYVPFARLLAALPLGYGLYETKRQIAGRPEEKSEPRKAVEAFSNVGGAGLALDIFRGINPLNGKYLDPGRRVSMAVSTLGGPTAGLGTDIVGGVSEVSQRKTTPEDGLEGKVTIGASGEKYTDATPLARTALRQIPIVGTAIQNRTLPYDTSGRPTINLFPAASAAGEEPVSTQSLPGQAGVLTGANDTPEAKAAAKAKKAANKAGVASGERLGGTKELDSAQTRIDRITEKFPDKLSNESKTILTRHAKLNESGREKFDADPKNTLNLKLAQYEQAKLGGKLTKLEDYKLQQGIVRLKVSSDFSKEASQLHGMSKSALKEYFAVNPDQMGIFSEVMSLDKALTKAGLQEKGKFEYGLGSKGRKNSVVPKAPKQFSVGSIARPNISVPKAKKAAVSRRATKATNAVVSIKKSRV